MIKTLIFSAILVLLSILGLSIGLIITGKPKIKGGRCGNPLSKEKNGSCEICSKKKKK